MFRASDLNKTYGPQIKAACAAQKICDPARSHPIIKKMLAGLNDKHTNFYTAQEIAQFKTGLGSGVVTQRSLGIVTEPLGSGGQVIAEVYPNSPASRALWQVGDVIRSANAVALDGVQGKAALTRLGSREQSAEFRLERQGKAMTAQVTPGPVALELLSARPAPGAPDITLIRLRAFLPGVAQQLHDALRAAQNKSADTRGGGVILDLRWNGGGLLDEYLLALAAFMDPPKLINQARFVTTTLGYQSGKLTLNGAALPGPGLSSPVRYSGKLVVLVDRDTASAAEYLATDLLGRPGTTVIGEPTYGLGDTGTTLQELSDGSVLQITTISVLNAQKQPRPSKVIPPVSARLDLRQLTSAGQDSMLSLAIQTLNSTP